MLRTVRLYGALAKKFGREFKYDVNSPQEAVAALKATVPGFEAHLIEHSEPGYHVFTGKENIGVDQLAHPTNQVIRIVPAIVGAKKSGTLQTILGIVLVVVGVFTTIFGDYSGSVIQLGVSLIIGGVAQMLFAPPKPKTAGEREAPNNRPSYSFGGPVNTAQQGNCVPVGYGRLIVGSQVISAGMYVESL
jgi:predicted phage tail protein